jgi:peptidoglycan/LPS O-acetylase OafA/YrhL
MQSTTERHIASLDGLRGVAILAVIADHAWGQYAGTQSILAKAVFDLSRLGYGGVDLFFVLSGFLITRILLRTRNTTNFYRAFYWRRLLRIAPLYYCAVALVFFVVPAVAHVRHTPIAVQLVFWFNVSNFWAPFHSSSLPLLGPFWSLAIEEQFYLLWPFVVRRVEPHVLKPLCLAGLFFPMLLRLLCPSLHAYFYHVTPFHCEALFGGALLALLDASGELHRWERLFRSAVVPCLIAFAFSVTHNWHGLRLDLTFIALASTAVVGLCLTPGALTHLFELRLLRRFGDYSYFMYVFHIMILLGLQHHLHPLHHPFAYELLYGVLTVAISFGCGAISHRYFEAPILSLKRLVPYQSSTKTYA